MLEYFLYFYLFFFCCVMFYVCSGWLVEGLMRTAKFLGWKEFVVAFLIMALAATIPNLFLAISAIWHGLPELSLGDVMGGNVVDMTLVIALAVIFSKDGIPAKGKMIQTTSFYMLLAALAPLVLMLDGTLSRADGAILIMTFFLYLSWLFAKKERFSKIYDNYKIPPALRFKIFLVDLAKIAVSIAFLLIVAEGIVRSANFFAQSFNIPLALVGILVVGMGNALPELYFSIASARKGETRLVLGDIMGAVIIPATLVLGIVALSSPISVKNISLFVVARWFLMISAVFFYFFVRTDSKITKREAFILLLIYFVFVIMEILSQ